MFVGKLFVILLAAATSFVMLFKSYDYVKNDTIYVLKSQMVRIPNQQRRRLSTTNYLDPKTVEMKVKARPVMHTFYETSTENTGMTKEEDEALLKLWKESWVAVGYNVRILTLDDAKRHPSYEEYRTKLQKVPFPNRIYNELCYMRWLAMATVGGGWLSDYDLMPTQPLQLYHEKAIDDVYGKGGFTVYSSWKYYDGRLQATPCLMSGSAEEWNTMAFKLLQNGLDVVEGRLKIVNPSYDPTNAFANKWVDMIALGYVFDTYRYRHFNTVVEGADLLTGKPWTANFCRQLKFKYNAIHFSHNMIHRGVLRDGETYHDRPVIAKNILDKVRRECL